MSQPPQQDAVYRMIAIDLDGTLLSPHGTVTQRTREAVHKALEAGLLVCFATGRNFTESRGVLDEVAHHGAAVFVGGAMVIDTKHRVTLHRTMMEPQLAAELCAELEAAGHAALALQDTATAGCDYLVSEAIEIDPETAAWMRVTNAQWKRVGDLIAASRHEHTIRVGMVSSREVIEPVKRRLEARFKERIYLQSVLVPTKNVEVLEVFDPSVNKWEGILHVARRHRIDPAQIIAIGDDVNDLHMIRSAGLGVAMGNAKEEVRSIAKRIIGSNRDDGLAVFLEELVATHAVQPIKEDDDDPNTEAA
jgi:5-amino-6-(5-phospho-D-ribitylamino)uracil phosphatase